MAIVKHDRLAEAFTEALSANGRQTENRSPLTRGWFIYHMVTLAVSAFGIGFAVCLLVPR